jgi:hypothetical protein
VSRLVKLNDFHRKNLIKLCKKHGVDYQTIDFDAYWDSSLSLKENYAKLKEMIKSLSNSEKVLEEKYQKDEKELLEREATAMEEQYYKEEFDKRIESIKQNSIMELQQYFSDYYEHIESFLENKKVNGFLCVGKGGVGKTFNLIYKLKSKNLNFILLKGHYTPLSFYKTLYQNRENQILIIDDIIKFLDDKDIMGLLLSALDYDNKVCSWSSSSPLTADLPHEFIFNSKIFILSNEFDEKNEFLKALKDRCVFYEMSFSKEQIIEMLYIMAKRNNYPLELVDYIKELAENSIIENLSLRLIDKLYPYYSKPNWKTLIKQILEFDELKNLVFELIKSNKSVKEQVEAFRELTGLSRTYYFYLKAKIQDKVDSWYEYNRKVLVQKFI